MDFHGIVGLEQVPEALEACQAKWMLDVKCLAWSVHCNCSYYYFPSASLL